MARSSWGYFGGEDYGGYPVYVPVAERKKDAAKAAAALEKKGKKVSPIVIEGRTIASTFWGKAWCQNLERYSDYENRLPRGRSYVRNGSVIDLQITPGQVTALVQGSRLYKVSVDVVAVKPPVWSAIIAECTGKIDSVVELLTGKLSASVMEVITRKGTGLFPAPADIHLHCSCPDSATMCKHVAAVLYGVGARLDRAPELLFDLRSANPGDLVTRVAEGGLLGGKSKPRGKTLSTASLSSVFGIDMDDGEEELSASPAPTKVPVGKRGSTPKASVGKSAPTPKVAAVPAPAPTKVPVGKSAPTPKVAAVPAPTKVPVRKGRAAPAKEPPALSAVTTPKKKALTKKALAKKA